MTTRSTLADLTPSFLFLLLTATLGPLLFGYHLAELNAPSEVITCAKKSIQASTTISRLTSAFKEHFVKPQSTEISASALPQCIPMNTTEFGLISSFFTLGGLLGALAAGPISAKSGRVRTMLYAALFATVGPIFEALAPNIGTMTLGRFIAGLGAGGAMVVCPLYIFDIAPPGRKGFFGSFTQVMVNVGILITQVLGYFLSRGQLWRVILGVGGMIGAVQATAFLLGGQESPKWMADVGKVGAAKRVLRKIRGQGADIEAEVTSWGVSDSGRDEDDEEERLVAGSESPDDEQAPSSNGGLLSSSHKSPQDSETLGAFAVLRDPRTRPAVFAITMIMCAQQFTGINSIIMYGVSLLSNLLAANSALLNVAVSGLNVIVTASAAPLVDKLGRKTCLLISITGMGISSILLAIGIMCSLSILSAIAVLAFVASFGLGLGPVPFILASELVDANAVGATQSWALAANWIATFVVAQFFPMLNEAMGKGQVYFVFAAMAVAFGGFVAWFVPESKGRADADEVWGRGKGRERVD
ncbi:Bifunctional purine biosynthesis protein PurH [Vermiconidia calcicola]|uniref:Bifunctional purine biosynthesis protein PurH n=1 Tax=Vermiconidia calcicola TaxID=1690605 RepID=A0ACC3NID6_9PEZI|nr:Bifunctional purine biosynthesis protein PurH [Vermiconidia calcicola]